MSYFHSGRVQVSCCGKVQSFTKHEPQWTADSYIKYWNRWRNPDIDGYWLTSSRYLSVCTVSCLRPATGGGVCSLSRAFLVCCPCALLLASARRRASCCRAAGDSPPSVWNHSTESLAGKEVGFAEVTEEWMFVEAIKSALMQTRVFSQTAEYTRRDIPEYSYLNSHCYENLSNVREFIMCNGVGGWDTALHAGRLRVRLPMGSVGCFLDITLLLLLLLLLFVAVAMLSL